MLCDFGLAAIEAAAAGTSFVDLPGTSAKGTYRWMAPELIDTNGITDQVLKSPSRDIFALGCTMLEVSDNV